MRVVTWNINGLASLKFPFHIHAAHSHRYPPLTPSQPALSNDVPADAYDYDETALTDSPPAVSAPPSVAATDWSPQSPSFPAFPARRLPLVDVQVASHDELIAYFQADVVCLQEVKIGRGRMDLLARAVRQTDRQTDGHGAAHRRTGGRTGGLKGVKRCSRATHRSLQLCLPCQAFASGYDSFFSFCRKRPVS